MSPDQQRNITRTRRQAVPMRGTNQVSVPEDDGEKIEGASAYLMIGAAVLIDLTQLLIGIFHFIPAVGNAIAVIATTAMSVCAWLAFFMWFKIKGISFFGKVSSRFMTRRILTYVIIPLIEFIPVIKVISPGWTLFVFFTIKMHNATVSTLSVEDRARLDRMVKTALRKGIASAQFYNEINELARSKNDSYTEIQPQIENLERYVRSYRSYRRSREYSRDQAA